MMARFHESEFGYAFESGDGLDLELDQHNLWVWMNRSEPFMDMAQVNDPRDGESWFWFRDYLGDESFDDIYSIARKVGSVVVRATPTEDVQDVWHQRHAAPNDIGSLYASE